jgi:hypothetical protein
VTDGGGEETAAGRKMTALIVAVFVGSAAEVATIVSVCEDASVAGAVYVAGTVDVG